MTQSARDRYLTDGNYKRLVDTLEYLIHSSQFTPSEMREAAILASINHEMYVVRSRHIVMTSDLHCRLEELHEITEEQR